MTAEAPEEVGDRYRAVRRRLDTACREAGRSPDEVVLVGASKRQSIDRLQAAWEAGLRVSWADLDSRDVQGGEQVNFGVAVNYYRRQNLRVMMNLLRFNAKSIAGSDKGWILQARVQYNR